MTALGVFIRQRRVSRELTQADLARQIGVDATYISGIESGRKRPGSAQLLKAIDDALQLDEEGRLPACIGGQMKRWQKFRFSLRIPCSSNRCPRNDAYGQIQHR